MKKRAVLFDIDERKLSFFSSQCDLNREDFHAEMNRRMIVPPDQMHRHHYTTANANQPFSYAATPEQPTSLKKQIQYDTDAWVTERERTLPEVSSECFPLE